MDKQLKDTIEEQGWWIEREKYCEWTLSIITPHDLEYEVGAANSTFLEDLLTQSEIFNEDRFVEGCSELHFGLHYEDAVNDAKWLKVKMRELYNAIKDLEVFNGDAGAKGQEEVG